MTNDWKKKKKKTQKNIANRLKTTDIVDTSQQDLVFRSNTLEDNFCIQHNISTDTLITDQEKNPFFSGIIKVLNGIQPIPNTAIRAAQLYTIKDKVLYRVQKRPRYGKVYLLFIPQALTRKLFEEVHASPISGHFGVTKVYTHCVQKYYFPRMKQLISLYTSQCLSCQELKKHNSKKHGELLHHPLQKISEEMA